MKVLWIVLYVNVEWDEIFFDVSRQTGVAVRLSFEPCAGASARRGAEIDQQRFILVFGLI